MALKERMTTCLSLKNLNFNLTSKYIIVAISGGPGNQLFQFAAGYYLSKKINARLILDHSWFNSSAEKSLGPQAKSEFVLPSLIDSSKFAFSISSLLAKPLKAYFFTEAFLKGNKSYRINEINEFKFDYRFDEIKNSVFLNGFWQADIYTKDIDFSFFSKKFFKEIESCIDKEIMNKILSPGSICVSIRRGDYDESLLVCDEKFFFTGIEKITNYLKDLLIEPYIFVFSDDTEYASQLFSKMNYKNLSVIKKFNGIEKWKSDFYLGSLCSHHIISNSSFSWWVAKINNNFEPIIKKKVIAPKYWWRFLPVENLDIYPKNWDII